jgi:hypothetical protein
LPFLCHSYRRSALVADVLIVCEDDEFAAGNRVALSEWCGQHVQLKVYARGRLPELFGTAFVRQFGWDRNREAEMTRLLADARSWYPLLMVDLRPLYGAALQELLRGYSHWGWIDLDMLFGDLPTFLAVDELLEYDVITFTSDLDTNAPFVHGQLTLHANNGRVNGLWARCVDLGEAFVARLRARFPKHTHVFMEEGCYSRAVLTDPQARVLLTFRQVFESKEMGAELVVLVDEEIRYCTRGPRLSACMRALGQPLDAVERQRREERAHTLVGTFEPAGPLERVPVKSYTQKNCQWWIKREHRTCFKIMPRATPWGHDLLYVNGSFSYRERRPRPDVPQHDYQTAAFFHFLYGKSRYAKALPTSPAKPSDPYTYSPELVLPTRENTNGQNPACAMVECGLNTGTLPLTAMRCRSRPRAS